MSEPAENVSVKPSNLVPSVLLEDVFFTPRVQALQTPGITRGCNADDDCSFAALAVLSVLENSKTGCDFIHTHGQGPRTRNHHHHQMAEREGFEPSVELPLRSLSKGVLSTTQPPFHDAGREV